MNPDWRWAAIAAGALSGENIVSWIIVNSKGVFSRIIDIFFRKRK